MMMSETLSASGVACVQIDEPASPHPDNFLEGGDDEDGGPPGLVWDPQFLSDS